MDTHWGLTIGVFVGSVTTYLLMEGYAAKYYGRLGVVFMLIFMTGGLILAGIMRGAS